MQQLQKHETSYNASLLPKMKPLNMQQKFALFQNYQTMKAAKAVAVLIPV